MTSMLRTLPQKLVVTFGFAMIGATFGVVVFSPAAAQSTLTAAKLAPVTLAPVTQNQRDRMSRSLVAVQTVTLLRDRGVLDESQRVRVATLERQLAAALAARDSASGDAAKAQSVLEQARQALDVEVNALGAANQGLQREINELRSDVFLQASALSDQEVRQRQRFADGDTSALDLMDKLATQREAAIDRAAKQRRAESRRDMARNFAIAVGRGDPGRTSLDVLTRWDEAAAIDPSDFWTHIERSRLAEIIGDLNRASGAAEQASRVAQEPWQRSAALAELGDILIEQGNLAAARTAFSQSLDIDRAEFAAEPSSRYAQRAVSVSLQKLGDVVLRAGDVGAARAAFDESLSLSRALSLADPTSVQAKFDMSSGLERVGDVAVTAGDLARANLAYTESLAIYRALLAANPNSLRAKRSVVVGGIKVGDVLKFEGNLTGALSAYTQALALARALSASDPSSAKAKRDLSVVLVKFGDVVARQGDQIGARTVFTQSLTISRELSAADPSSAQAKRNVSIGLERLGNIAMAAEDLAAANVAFSESLDIDRTLTAADPGSALAKRNLSVSIERMGDIARKGGDGAGALVLYRESLRIRRALSLTDPSSAFAKRDLSVSLDKTGDVMLQLGDLDGARIAFTESLTIARALSIANPTSAEGRRNWGVALLRLVPIPGTDISWAIAAEHWRAAKRDGMWYASDDKLLLQIERQAVEEAATASVPVPSP